jgi:hypothetical protein
VTKLGCFCVGRISTTDGARSSMRTDRYTSDPGSSESEQDSEFSNYFTTQELSKKSIQVREGLLIGEWLFKS